MRWRGFVTGLTLAAASVFAGSAARGDIRGDEEALLLPVDAAYDADAERWHVTLRVWVFEPERDSTWRQSLLVAFGRSLGLTDAEIGSNQFRRRAAMFVVDNERGKTVGLDIAGERVDVGPTDVTGHAARAVTLPAEAVSRHAAEGWLTVEAVARDGKRRFTGRVQLVEPTGVSVISDIDDTIKISEVTDRLRLLRRTFVLTSEPVPGMAALYETWRQGGARFHYVSASPWQLLPDLDAFAEAHGLPRGSFHLRQIRLKDESMLTLVTGSEGFKRDRIQELLHRYPRRRFILVGDSGERDPEIYGLVARAHRDQVVAILIRNVTGQGAADPRYAAAFGDWPRERWIVFDDPGEVDAAGIVPREPG